MVEAGGERQMHRGHGAGDRLARAWLLDVAVFLPALVLRLVYLRESAAAPTFAAPIIDAGAYHDIATALAQGHHLKSDLFWQPALYPLLLAAIYAVGGVSILTAQIAQAFLGALTCVLTRRLGTRLFGARIGLAAGLATASYGPLIFHEAELLAAGLAAFWSVALLLMLTDERRRSGSGWAFLWGLCGGLSVLTRTEFLAFFLAASLVTLLSGRRPAGARRLLGRSSALLAAGFAAVILPASLLNERQSGHFTFLPASGGVNLFIGNNPEPCRTLAIRPGWAWERLVHEPLREGARDDWEGQRYFLNKTVRFAREDPGRLLSGLADKAGQLLSSREIPRNLDIYLFRRWSALLRLLVWKQGSFGFPFGVLFPLAAAGIVLERRRIGWPVALYLLLYPAALLVVFVSARYRVPAVPVLAILAAAGGGGVASALRRREWPSLRRAAVVVVVATLLATLPGPFCAERLNLEAELYHLVGTRKFHEGLVEDSVADFRKALSLDPRYVEAHNYLGTALYAQGNTEEGLAHLRSAIEINPSFEHAYNNIGSILAKEGRVVEAMESYRRAIAANPYLGDAYFNLGNLMAGQGRVREAIELLRRGLALQPESETARRQLEALERRGH
jgi:tetratricopeptide (TPR) repeat protein